MSIFDSIEQVGRIAERARLRQAKTVPITPEMVRERERHVIAYLCSWGTLTPGAAADGSPVWNVFQRGTFRDQLAQRSASDISIRFKAYHDIDLGFWGPLMEDSHGLRGLAVVDESPAADELIEAINDGRSTHVSLAATVIRSIERTKLGPGGWPVFDIVEARLTEAGPTPTDLAKDVGAVIESLGGVEPRWIGQVQRSKILDGLRPVPTLVR